MLEALCFDVDVRPSNADETWPGGDIEEGAMIIARRKLQATQSQHDIPASIPIIAADTLVVLSGAVLGKPPTRAEAIAMLTRLSFREHRVITAFCLALGDQVVCRAVITRVKFRELPAAEIERYVDTGESYDKAGGYGIQGVAGALVDHLVGSYTNVVGLPLAEVLEELDNLRGASQ